MAASGVEFLPHFADRPALGILELASIARGVQVSDAVIKKAPSTLRLSYLADVEDEKLVERRLEAVEEEIAARWKARGSAYPLAIEPEIFWRRSGPATHGARSGGWP